MMIFLGLGLWGYPLLAGLLLAAAGRRFPRSLRQRAAYFGFVIPLFSLLAALLFNGYSLQLAPEWWPGSGAIFFKFGFWGIAAAFWTTAIGLAWYEAEIRQNPELPWWHEGLLLLVMTSANAAFLSGNFLLRYASLEFAALGIAIVQLLGAGTRSSQRLYLGFRLGDTGLLIAIILLIYAGASLEIDQALELASSLPQAILNWAAAGFALAVWVKTGAWPFVFWQKASRETHAPSISNWFLGSVMPNLGFYLLYRTAQLMHQTTTSLQTLISITAAVSALAALFFVWAVPQKKDQRLWLFTFQAAIAIFSAMIRLEVLIWVIMLSTSILRLPSINEIKTGIHNPNHENMILLASGGLSALLATVVVWAAPQPNVNMFALWIMEACLALIILWLIKTWRQSLTASRSTAAGSSSLQGQSGIPVLWMLLIAILFLPFLFSPLYTSEMAAFFLPFKQINLDSIPFLSPVFWTMLLSVWLISKIHRLEKFEDLARKLWHTWNENLQKLPQSLYQLLEVKISQEGFNQASNMIASFSTRLYEGLEQATLERGLQRIYSGFLSAGRLLSRLHTGRLRINMIWVTASAVIFLILALWGFTG